jgi:hypothetical protein
MVVTVVVLISRYGVYATLLQLGARFEGLDTPVLAFDLRIGAG